MLGPLDVRQLYDTFTGRFAPPFSWLHIFPANFFSGVAKIKKLFVSGNVLK